MDANIGCVLAVVSKEALPLWTLHPRRRGASGAGVAGCGPELLLPGIAWGAPTASRGHVLALCAAGRTNPLPRHPLDSTATTSFGRKRRQGRDRKPQPEAQRRERMRIPGEAFTLDASGSYAACRPGGEEQGEAAGPAPGGQSGKNGRGMQPNGGPKRSAEICAVINEKASLMARPMRTQHAHHLPLTEPPVADPQFLLMFCETCCR